MTMNYTEIIRKLIGETYPYGASEVDAQRLENLKEMCNLVDDLMVQIAEAATFADRHERSMKEIGKYASEYLTNLKTALKP